MESLSIYGLFQVRYVRFGSVVARLMILLCAAGGVVVG